MTIIVVPNSKTPARCALVPSIDRKSECKIADRGEKICNKFCNKLQPTQSCSVIELYNLTIEGSASGVFQRSITATFLKTSLQSSLDCCCNKLQTNGYAMTWR